jgi:hypothetical protein
MGAPRTERRENMVAVEAVPDGSDTEAWCLAV